MSDGVATAAMDQLEAMQLQDVTATTVQILFRAQSAPSTNAKVGRI